jgi:predicted secreted protein
MRKRLTYLSILFLSLVLIVSIQVNSSDIQEKSIIKGNYTTIVINKTLQENQKWEYKIQNNNILEVVSESYTKQLKTENENVINDIHTWYLNAKSTGNTTIDFYLVNDSGQKITDQSIQYKINVLPETIEVRAENLVKIELKENRSTGYSWHLEIENNNIAKVHHDNYIEPESNYDKAGESGIHYWYIKGCILGETKLTFKYYRDWDQQNIEEIKEYNIKVVN